MRTKTRVRRVSSYHLRAGANVHSTHCTVNARLKRLPLRCNPNVGCSSGNTSPATFHAVFASPPVKFPKIVHDPLDTIIPAACRCSYYQNELPSPTHPRWSTIVSRKLVANGVKLSGRSASRYEIIPKLSCILLQELHAVKLINEFFHHLLWFIFYLFVRDQT